MSAGNTITTCSNCGTSIEKQVKFCPECGNRSARICVCGEIINVNQTVCPNCGEQNNYSSLSQVLPTMSEMPNSDGVNRNYQQPELPEGTILQHFELTSVIGRGSFGAVYKARNTIIETDVAVKLVGRFSSAEKLLNTLKEEYRIQSTIAHPNLLRVESPLSFKEQNMNWVLLPMELASSSLRQWLTETDDSKDRISLGIKYFRQACLGVKAIHEHKKLHLDLKPENMLLVSGDDETILKISDFGLSRSISGDGDRDSLFNDGIGTPMYMAPEQILSANWRDVSTGADIYALGLILYEIVSGSAPFSGTTGEILKKKRAGVQPSKFTGNVSVWNNIIFRCIDQDSEKRYSDVTALIKDIDNLIIGLVTSSDVSCKNCQHINRNSASKFCESCNEDISYVFESCPKCAKYIRLDVEICDGCGHNMGKDRLFELRSKQVDILKDEDPDEAIRILESMLKEGHNVTEKEYNLIKKLRKKQEEIAKIISETDNPKNRENLPELLRLWKSIFSYASRHKLAKHKIAEIEYEIRLLDELNKITEHHVNHAEFKQAIEKTEHAFTQLRVRSALTAHLSEIRKKHEAYEDLTDNIKLSEKSKERYACLQYIEQALQISPDADELIQKKSKNVKVIKDNDARMHQIESLNNEARFDEAFALLTKIQDIQSDYKNIKKLFDTTTEKNKVYHKHIELYQNNIGDKKVLTAISYLNEALMIAPDDSFIQSELNNLNELIAENERRAKLFNHKLLKASFEDASNELEKIISTQSDFPNLNLLQDKFDQNKIAWTDTVEKMQVAEKEGRIDDANEHAKVCLGVAPNNKEAIQKNIQFEEIIDEVTQLNADINRLKNEASFKEAYNALKRIKKIWPAYKTEKLDETIKNQESVYFSSLQNAKKLLDELYLESAKEFTTNALDSCPNSLEAKNLLSKVESKIKEVNKLVVSAKSRFKKAEFDLAKSSLLSAQKKWSGNAEVEEELQILETKRIEYTRYVEKAYLNLKKYKLTEAMKFAKMAQNICPDSTEVKNLIDTIQNTINDVQRGLYNLREILKFSGLILLIVLPGIVSFLYFLNSPFIIFQMADFHFDIQISYFLNVVLLLLPLMSSIYQVSNKSQSYYSLYLVLWKMSLYGGFEKP